MANDDSKPKFLPRHLQRSQPATSQKSKRRVTVEDEIAGDEESDRRSVFERLGPGGSQRCEKKPCFEFQEHGECQYGKLCSYSHVVKEHSKSRDNEASPDNLKLKFKGGKDRENKVKSQVVVRGKAGGGSDDDTGDDSEDGWSMDKLEDKKELELEQKRLEIQRALEALEAVEEVPLNNRKTESSSSDSSPDRAHKKKKDKTSKKKEKKKHKKLLPEKEQIVDKSKEGKRRHDSDDDDEDLVPHKKRKKKIKDKKHGEEPPLPAVVEPVPNKHKKAQGTKSAKVDLYDPESPTSIARDDTPIDKRSLSESPKIKGKGKKKKKKVKNQAEPPEKSKKLVSPLKKVLKVKRSSTSKIASRHSRSASRDTHPRKQSRSRSSSKSSGSSSSHSPVRRKKGHEISRDKSKKAVRPLDKKKRVKGHRTTSSSSTTSSSTSSSSESRSRRRPRKASLSHDRSVSRTHKTRSPIASTVRKDVKGDKKKRGASAETWVRTKDRGSESKQRQSLDRGRDKDRGRKGERVNTSRRTLSQTVTKLAKDGRNDSRDRRKDGRDQKAGKTDSKEVVRRDNRDGGKPDRAEHRKEGQRERDSSRGDHRDANIKDREKRGMSQDRDERLRRGTQQADRGSRFPQRSGEDGDRRHFDESRGRFTGEGQRIGQFGGDRQRGGFDSGTDIFDRPGQRENFDQRGRGRGDFSGPGRGGGRDWEERGRRDGGDVFRDGWEAGRDGRGNFGGFREDGAREFGGGRDDRRGGGRGERLLPHLGGGVEGGKSALLPDPDGRDRSQQKAPGYRDEVGAREGGEKRDWKQREGSTETPSKRNSKEKEGRGGKDEAGSENKQPRSGAKSTAEPSSRDKASDKDAKSKNVEKSGSKQSVVMKVVKTESGKKEESPLARDEPSLATLFSQTETVVSKKKPTKSFGGKKSPKKTEESKGSDKAKPVIGGRLAGRGLRAPDKKVTTSKISETSRGKESAKDKDDKSGKKEEPGKEKPSRTPSPKGSQKSGDSRHSQSKSSKRSSKSPELKRATARSPTSSKRLIDTVKSPGKSSHSPAPSAGRDKEKERDQDRTRSLSPSRDRRRTTDSRRYEKSKANERVKKRERSRSHTRSDSESRRSSHSGGLDEKRRRKSSDSESLPAKLEGGDIAAAMLGDGLDDGQQDVFSDWSEDDDADNILIDGKSKKHQVEDLDHQPEFPRNRRSPASTGRYGDIRDIRQDQDSRNIVEPLQEKPVLEKNIPYVKIVEDIQKEKPIKEKRKRNTDNVGYEEISSDENDLDEEGERLTKRTIVGILDIDMASLLPASKPDSSSAPVFQRFQAASLFAEMGLSQAYAGDKLYQEVQDICQKQLEDLAALEKPSTEVKEETKAENSSDQQTISPTGTSSQEDKTATAEVQPVSTDQPKVEVLSIDIKPLISTGEVVAPSKPLTTSSQKSLSKRADLTKPVRTPTLTQAQKPEFKLYSGTSAYHKLYKAKALERSGLLANFGVFRRALTARKDLEIRRQLCRIDPKYDQSAVYPSGVLDPENFRLSMQLFKQKKSSIVTIN